MDREKFEEVVAGAVNDLPELFLGRLENVEIVVENRPTPRQLYTAGLGHDQVLLGLYEGVPQTERGGHYGMVLPDKITIFKEPIETRCRSEAEIRAEVRKVVMHEIAHHFGTSDARLQEIERDDD